MFTVSAILRLFRIIVQQDTLDTLVASAEAFDVPPALVLAVCIHESTLGMNPRAHRLCGCGARRGTGTSTEEQGTCAAQVLSSGYTNCRSWEGSLMRYRSGRCTGTNETNVNTPNRYDRIVLRIAGMLGWQPRRTR